MVVSVLVNGRKEETKNAIEILKTYLTIKTIDSRK